MAMVAAAVGTALSVVGSKQAADQQQQLADDESKQARAVGAYNASVKREEGRRLVGAQRASYAASGVVVDTDSTAANVMEQTDVETNMDAVAAYYQGNSKAALIENRGYARSTSTMFNGMASAGSSAYSLLR
ncbi:hypothetical protein [Halodesulfovibrio spirochaetisodalis]|uniref:Uncharacterized protein n=1 Tax=Halodesulfovibrio spirochaetisodalis TaxID=1560234 RepID=A0A1B7XA36_9BACT|nr:hypothetical protein [Halodesulfovibrio spirochaetisodalis]OBQ46208.1 hypothetical protein SP90_13485 [Halodesulfovibrio spirochaetisodalis]